MADLPHRDLKRHERLTPPHWRDPTDPANYPPRPAKEEGPAWQKWAAFVVLAAAVAAVIVFRRRLSADFIPLDGSRVGPNLIASIIQWAVIFTAAALLWPPWRRRLHRFVDRKIAPLHARVDELHVRHDEHAQSLALLHKKLDQLEAPKPAVRARPSRAKPKPKEKP